MTLPDEIIKQCPYCGLDGTLKEFGTWEKDGKRGLLGKTPEGYLMFLCPRCQLHIKYDPISDSFTREENVGENRHVPLIMGAISVAAALFIVFYFSGWWKYLVGTILLAFGWVSLKTGIFATNKEIEELTTSIPLSEETKRKFNDRLINSICDIRFESFCNITSALTTDGKSLAAFPAGHAPRWACKAKHISEVFL